MRALIADPNDQLGLRFAEVSEPQPRANQALIKVQHASLNHGDLNDARSGRVARGHVLGSDAAGVVIAPAADGSGPPLGSRVVALAAGAFAERIAVDTANVALVPAPVELAHAATLPVAGLAAWRALRASGPLLGRRVLITGASGGVGVFAIQLAARAGAYVIASVGSAARGERLRTMGADAVVVGLEGLDEPLDVVLDTVGGASSSPSGSCSHRAAACTASAGPPTSQPCSRRIR
jgi:NADPH:quinone reductase